MNKLEMKMAGSRSLLSTCQLWPPERIEMLSVTQELEQSVKCKVASIIVHHGVPAYHCPVQYYAYIENTFMHIEDNTFIYSPHHTALNTYSSCPGGNQKY